MKTITQRTTFYLLRFYRLRDKSVLYAYDTRRHANKRQWWYTKKEGQAYHFNNRSDARGALRSVSFQNDLLHPKSVSLEAQPDRAYFFEIIQVVETTIKSYVEQIEVTDAPAMVVLGRCAQ